MQSVSGANVSCSRAVGEWRCQDVKTVTESGMSSSGTGDAASDSERASVASLKAVWPWIEGICSVLFDIDVGQTVRDIVPGRVLTEEEESAVAFNAFPVRQHLQVE
jgi:hypothetical protein